MTTKIEFEPPDGGWGILVCIGMALQFIIGISSAPSFGLLFGDFLKTINAGTSEIAIINSISFFALSTVGLFSGSIFSRFGLRPAGLFAAFTYFCGSIAAVFVNSTLTLIIVCGLIQAGSFGLLIPACLTTFNNYFVKNRILWMSVTQSIIGVGAMLYPIVLQKLLDWYGFRGCLVVLAGINSHVILGMMLMHPVKWHMRRIEIEEPEEHKEFIPLSEKKINQEEISDAKMNKTNTNTNLEEEILDHLSPLENNHQKHSMSREDLKTHAGSLGPVHQKHLKFSTEDLHINIEPLAHDYRRHSKFSREDLKIRSSRSSSIVSLGNWTGPIIVSDASPEMIIRSRTHSTHVKKGEAPPTKVEEPQLSLSQKIVDFLDLTLLKSPVFVNIVLGISFALYSDMTFFTLQPLYLFELNFSKPETATIIAIGAAADLLSRIVLAIFAIFIQMPPRYIYLAGSFFSIIGRFSFIYVSNFLGVALTTAVMGFLRTWIHVPLPLVFAEYLPKERFAKGYGLFMFLQGSISFVIGPLVGYLRDATQDYIFVFHVLNFIMAFCAIPWIIELIFVKFRRKRNIVSTIIYK